jgi:hypothetical protein
MEQKQVPLFDIGAESKKNSFESLVNLMNSSSGSLPSLASLANGLRNNLPLPNFRFGARTLSSNILLPPKRPNFHVIVSPGTSSQDELQLLTDLYRYHMPQTEQVIYLCSSYDN